MIIFQERCRGLPYFRPTIEPDIDLEEMDEPFITEEPWKLMEKGKFQRVPLLIGYTANEGIYMCQGTYFLHYYVDYEPGGSMPH